MLKEIDQYLSIYKQGLLENILPFWIRHSIDAEHGGFLFCLDRDGTVVDTDKGVWQHGRFTWMLATMYNEVSANEEWLKLAIHGADFIVKHCIDDDGRMFFVVDQKGNPVRKRRYAYSETFASVAFAALYRATGDEKYRKLAIQLFETFYRYATEPGLVEPKFTEHRQMKSMGYPMIGIVTSQELVQLTCFGEIFGGLCKVT